MELLNKEQKYAIECVKDGCNILLTGSAGTGARRPGHPGRPD